MDLLRDCKDCGNCDSLHGFMATCRLSKKNENYIEYIGKDIHRKTAEKCEDYTTKKRDPGIIFPF